ncbi:MAG: chaperonin GroEL [Chloroflexi bacterium OHK40]
MSGRPAVLLADEARAGLRQGFEQLAALLALTLGPTQGGVLASREVGRPVEALSSAATIARRFLSLPDPAQSAGAMLLRNMVWRVHEAVGDGCATAAVLARALVAEGTRSMAAGIHPEALRQGIEAGAGAALGVLRRLALPAAGEEVLEAVARGVVGDERLAAVLAEIFALLGEAAFVEIEDYVAPYLEREYVSGGRWQARLASPYLITDEPRQRAVHHDCALALFAGEVTELAEVRPLLELVAAQGRQRLLLVAHRVAGEALAAFVLNHRQGQLALCAAELSRVGAQREADLDDLAALCGARVYGPLSGRLATVTAAGLGSARRVEAGPGELVVICDQGGQARPGRIAELRARLRASPPPAADEGRELQARLARMAGATVRLKLGALHAIEREQLRQQAERGVRAVRLALAEGVVPGGGAAFLAGVDAALAAPVAGDAIYGARAVASALRAPAQQIIANSGRRDGPALLAEIGRRPPGWGYDALRGQVVDLAEAGVLDAAAVAHAALQAATSAAVMFLTTDAVVLKRNPQLSFEP